MRRGPGLQPMDQQRVSELALLAQQRLAVPDVAAHQLQCVRYVNVKQSVPGSWVSRHDVGPEMDGVQELRMSIVEAPAEFIWPIRLGRCFKPAFKVSISVTHSKLLDLPVQLQAHLLSEAEVDNILTWSPVNTASGKGTGRIGPSAMLCGTLSRTAIIEAGKRNQWAHLTQQEGHTDASTPQNGHPHAAAFNMQNQHRLLQLSHGLGLPNGSELLFKAQGPPNPFAAVAQSMNVQNQQQQQSWNGMGQSRGSVGDLQDAAKTTTRMVTQEEFAFSDLRFAKPSRMSPVYIDQLIVLYSRPTVCTCRAEQWAPACTRLGLPDIAAARLDGVDSRSPRKGGYTVDGGQPMDGMQDDESWPVASTPSAMTTSVITDSSRGAPIVQQMHQRPQVETISGRISVGSQGGSGPLPQPLQVCQTMQPPQLLPLPLPYMFPTPVDIPAVAREVMDWCAESFNSLGLQRGLTDLDLQALVPISGVLNCPTAQALENLEQFRINFKACLSFMRHIAALWNRQSPCVIAGFAITKDIAGRRLASEPIGTFICRLSATSTQGGMALAVRVAAQHPHAGPDGVLHCLVTKADLSFNRGVQTLLRDHNGTTHLLDVYTGKRTDKRQVFASDYMRLNDILNSSKPVMPEYINGGNNPIPQAHSNPLIKLSSTTTPVDTSMTTHTHPYDSSDLPRPSILPTRSGEGLHPQHSEPQRHSGPLPTLSDPGKSGGYPSMHSMPPPSPCGPSHAPRSSEPVSHSHTHSTPHSNSNSGPLPNISMGLRSGAPSPTAPTIIIGDPFAPNHTRQYNQPSPTNRNDINPFGQTAAAFATRPDVLFPPPAHNGGMPGGHGTARPMQHNGHTNGDRASSRSIITPSPTAAPMQTTMPATQSHNMPYQVLPASNGQAASHSMAPPENRSSMSFTGLMMSSGSHPMSMDSMPATVNMQQQANTMLANAAQQAMNVQRPPQQQQQQQQQQQARQHQHQPILEVGPVHSVSQMFLDSASLDVAALLDSMAASSLHGSMHDMVLNTDEQEFAAALLGD